MADKNKQFCKYPSAFRMDEKLDSAAIKYFNLSDNNYPECKDCIYKKRKSCSGAYSSEDKAYDEKNLKEEIRKYCNHIKKRLFPKEIKIEVTPRCNLNCDFCFNINSFERNSKELSTKEISRIIDNIQREGIKIIRFTGGEPLLREDIIKILEYAKSKNLYVKVNTNSTLIKKEDIPKFKGIVDDFLFPLHSLNKDDIARKIELMRTMKKNNIIVRLNTVLTKENIRKLENFSDIVHKIHVKWFLARPVPTLKNKMLITNEDVAILIEKLMVLKNKYPVVSIENIPFCAYDPEKVRLFSDGARNCGIFNKLVIGPLGKIKPCYSINRDLGNALKISINDAWKSELPKNIRELTWLPQLCQECKYVYDCLGGCRFSAKLVNGSYSALDPLAMPEKYKEKLFGK